MFTRNITLPISVKVYDEYFDSVRKGSIPILPIKGTVTIDTVRAHLHQASVLTLRPLCDDTSDSVGCNPILEHHRRVVAALTLTLGVNGPLNADCDGDGYGDV